MKSWGNNINEIREDCLHGPFCKHLRVLTCLDNFESSTRIHSNFLIQSPTKSQQLNHLQRLERLLINPFTVNVPHHSNHLLTLNHYLLQPLAISTTQSFSSPQFHHPPLNKLSYLNTVTLQTLHPFTRHS